MRVSTEPLLEKANGPVLAGRSLDCATEVDPNRSRMFGGTWNDRNIERKN